VWNGKIIYVDPVGAPSVSRVAAPGFGAHHPIHADHLDVQTLTAVPRADGIRRPTRVNERLPASLRSRSTNWPTTRRNRAGLMIEAVPAYNLTPDRLAIPSQAGATLCAHAGTQTDLSQRDTETPRNARLKNIDGLLCMNLPLYVTSSSRRSGASVSSEDCDPITTARQRLGNNSRNCRTDSVSSPHPGIGMRLVPARPLFYSGASPLAGARCEAPKKFRAGR